MSARLTHPDLPQEQVIEVDDMSVPHYRSAGWEPVQPADITAAVQPAPSTAPAELEASEPQTEPAPAAAPKGRRAQKEADEK